MDRFEFRLTAVTRSKLSFSQDRSTSIAAIFSVLASGLGRSLAKTSDGTYAAVLKFWEAPLANFNNNDELRAWLRTQPREFSVALAARAALRVSPIVLTAERKDYMRDVVLPVFRAAAVAWAAGKYPAHEAELAAAAAAYAAYTAAAAPAAADAYGAACAAEAAYAVFAADAGYAADAVAYAAATAAVAAHAGDAAYAAATAALAVGGDAAHAVDAADFGVDHLLSATRAAAAASAASAARAARAFFWSALSADATRLEEGATASEIAGSTLWPKGQPIRLRSLWKVLAARLAAEKQDWQVWTNWYDDRLAGRVREEKCELAYVRIGNALWHQGPAIVNAEIKRRVDGG